MAVSRRIELLFLVWQTNVLTIERTHQIECLLSIKTFLDIFNKYILRIAFTSVLAYGTTN